MNNHFSLFNLPLSFEIDVNQLKQQYLQQQVLCHPDRFVQASPQEQRIAMQRTATLNEAFETLSSPISRAIYMQSLNSDIKIDQHTNMDIEFLEKQIELRESIDSITNDNEASQLQLALEADREQSLNTFAYCYERGDYTQSQSNLDRAMFYDKCLTELRYKQRQVN